MPIREKKEVEISDDGAEPPPLRSYSFPLNDTLTQSSLFFHDLILIPILKPKRCSIPISSRSMRFLTHYFPSASLADWNSWEWQLKNSFTSLSDLRMILSLSEDELRMETNQGNDLPIRITPYYASLMDSDNPAHPIRRSVVPVNTENIFSMEESADPLSEDTHSPVPGLVHRYPDRVLFMVTSFCSSYCRYCTRSRLVGHHHKGYLNREQWERALDYIAGHPRIRDVLLSGGDPLTLNDENLDYLLTRLSRIRHVEFLRIGTKVPVVLPQRITTSLIHLLKKFRPLWMSIHFTHPEEITVETSQACERLADAGIPLGSQTVLLKGINDNVETMKSLFHKLLKNRVRPYYLYQCDPIVGSSHFRTPVEKGLEIIQGLRGHTTGYAVPHYVIDAPAGGGKIPLLPDYFIAREGNNILLKNYEGKTFRYPDYIMSEY